MEFNSLHYLVFLAIVIVVYYIIPKNNIRNIFLLISSYYFYMSWEKNLFFLIIGVTMISYVGAILINRFEKYRNYVLFCCVFLSVSILFAFKYLNFFIDTIVAASNRFANTEWVSFEINILLPVGISFYTFQSISYLVDVYRGKINPEYRFVDYALYISFFPTVTSGPIERSEHFLPQLKTKTPFLFDNLNRGLQIFIWGLFKKVVIADRLALLVDAIYSDMSNYNGYAMLVAVFAFSLQMYCDFSAYSDLAIGSANMLGFELIDNFDTPYFACSVKDFWRRWHISLSSWFRDYVYIPLGGNRISKIRTKINLMITFLVSGLWHGANWTFIVWGGLHGILQIMEGYIWKSDGKNNKSRGWVLFGRVICTFVLVSVAWIFFRADSVNQALLIIKSCFDLGFSGLRADIATMVNNGFDKLFYVATVLSIIILLCNDLVKYKKGDYWFVLNRNSYMSALHSVMLCAFVFVLGIYGSMYDAATFIYFQF